MREYLILTFTFTAPFILLGLLNVIPWHSLRSFAIRVMAHLPHLPHSPHCPRNPITLSERR